MIKIFFDMRMIINFVSFKNKHWNKQNSMISFFFVKEEPSKLRHFRHEWLRSPSIVAVQTSTWEAWVRMSSKTEFFSDFFSVIASIAARLRESLWLLKFFFQFAREILVRGLPPRRWRNKKLKIYNSDFGPCFEIIFWYQKRLWLL